MSDKATVGQALALPGARRLDAELLLGHVLGCSRAALLAHPERPLTPVQENRFRALLGRRRRGEPLAYITGTKEFWSLTLNVTPDVLIPRPETETLVARALALAPAGNCRIADLGTGSGAIALALASERSQACITATDESAAVLAMARDNARRLGLHGIRFLQGDWTGALGAARFDVIASNPPYVAAADPHWAQPELACEPETALLAGEDGLAALHAIIQAAPRHLRAGGWLVLEHGAGQAAAVENAFRRAGFQHIQTHRDLAGLPRVTGGRVSR